MKMRRSTCLNIFYLLVLVVALLVAILLKLFRSQLYIFFNNVPRLKVCSRYGALRRHDSMTPM
jgi:hypothetical protein